MQHDSVIEPPVEQHTHNGPVYMDEIVYMKFLCVFIHSRCFIHIEASFLSNSRFIFIKRNEKRFLLVS